MSIAEIALRGLIVGLPLGFVLQRTRLCFNSAYRAGLLQRDYTLLRMIAVAILIQMVGLYAVVQLGVGGVQINVVPFYLLANVAGGFVFGLAMTYAEGCSSTVWYRVGNGNVGAFVTLIGFALGELLAGVGPVALLRERLQMSALSPGSGGLATVPQYLGISPWWLIVPLVLAAIVWLRHVHRSSYLNGWDWLSGGIALGLVGTLAWVVGWPTGWHYGIGVVGTTGPWLLAFIQGPGVLNWGSFVVATMPLGALIAALWKREFRWQAPSLPGATRMALAGIVMGASAAIAGGCNIGHGFSGLPTLALSSIVATLFTFFGAAAGTYWRFVRPQPVALKLPS